jgi:hypothetical protein
MKKTPMQMKKSVKSDPKSKQDHTSGKGKRAKSAMEKYADQRNASLQAAAVPSLMQHDPQSDLYHLEKAAEIKGDESRHRAAQAHAKKKMARLQKVMG